MTTNGGKIVRKLSVSEAGIVVDELRLARPDLLEAKLVDDDAGLARGRAGALEDNNVLLRLGLGHKGRAAVGEEQHDRPRALEAQELPPSQAHRPGPQARILHPGAEG